ncbi:MlaA family lipoprotein [Paraburkholderia solitsugae]|uniref:MlaA family lipoprotein n=1 Tax=Paraburkholderia solitsugae TaxID=2675748 RepID=UPI002E2CECE0|nr:VacJ family lipoprotein [Paraburkholderia solitsugae]
MTSILGLFGCATNFDRTPGDPLEPLNRAVFSFNDRVDTYVARPVAVGYTKITPNPIRTAIRNFFSNIGDVGNFSNDVLQLKGTDATEDLMRFAFNSTFGIGGLIDWATPAGLPKHNQDFGLTLGHYGVPSGFYLVLPLFGPSSLRDSTGWIFSYFTTPTSYLPAEASVPLFGVNFIGARADLLGATDVLSQAALDKYTFVRDAYMQRRRYLLNSGTAPPNYVDADVEPTEVSDTSQPRTVGVTPDSRSGRTQLSGASTPSGDAVTK